MENQVDSNEVLKKRRPVAHFLGLQGRTSPYPKWLYHEWHENILVMNTEEDEKARAQGYDDARLPVTSCQYLFNWRFDLEDMTARQLAQFAKDNFEVDLPVQAGRKKLFECIWRMHVKDPRNKDSVVLMAQSTRMRYDETVDYIKRVAEQGQVPRNCKVEHFEEEIWA